MQNLSPRYLTFFRTTYDKQGRKASVYHAEVQKGDTTSRGEAKYYYKDGALIKREELLNGQPVLVHTYLYNSIDLLQVETRTGTSGAYYRYVYQYNSNHMPIVETGYHFRLKATDTLKPHNLVYSGKSLLSESYFGGSYSQKQTNVTYSYDATGRISSKAETRDTLYRKISFEYAGPYITAVKTKTNTWYVWEHDPLLRNVFSFTPIPINYEIDYFYDDKGYLIKTSEKLNGILQWEVINVNIYY